MQIFFLFLSNCKKWESEIADENIDEFGCSSVKKIKRQMGEKML